MEILKKVKPNIERGPKANKINSLLCYRWITERHTREFVCGSNDSEHVHVDFSILGVIFSHPPSHSEEEVA